MIRPSELWGDGKSVKKRRPGTRLSAARAEGDEGGKKKRARKIEPEGMEDVQVEVTDGEEAMVADDEKDLGGMEVGDQSMANIFDV